MAIAGIGRIADTLEDRSIKVEMRRRMPSEPLEDTGSASDEAFAILARKAARWSEGMEDALADYRPEIPPGVINRLADNWRPLLAIADAIGGEWPDAARATLRAAVDAQEDGSDSARVMVLSDIQAVSVPDKQTAFHRNRLYWIWATWKTAHGPNGDTESQFQNPLWQGS
jgi:hypothetical protein